jgi:hypothetical protein
MAACEVTKAKAQAYLIHGDLVFPAGAGGSGDKLRGKSYREGVARAGTTVCARRWRVKKEAARLSPRERKERVDSTCAGGMPVRMRSSLKGGGSGDVTIGFLSS